MQYTQFCEPFIYRVTKPEDILFQGYFDLLKAATTDKEEVLFVETRLDKVD